MSRNVAVAGDVPQGNWNMVFVGVEGAPADHCGRSDDGTGLPFVTVDATPVVAEKPYLTIDASGHFALNRPAPKFDSAGPDFALGDGTAIPFEKVYVADAATDTAASINAKVHPSVAAIRERGRVTQPRSRRVGILLLPKRVVGTVASINAKLHRRANAPHKLGCGTSNAPRKLGCGT